MSTAAQALLRLASDLDSVLCEAENARRGGENQAAMVSAVAFQEQYSKLQVNSSGETHHWRPVVLLP